jgi:hypothetical protein
VTEEQPPTDLDKPAQAELEQDKPEQDDADQGEEVAPDQPSDDAPDDRFGQPDHEQTSSAIDTPDDDSAPPDVRDDEIPLPDIRDGLADSEPAPTLTAAATAAPLLPTTWPDTIPVSSPAPEPGRFDGLVVTPVLVILGLLVTMAFLMFVAIEPSPRWLLLFAAVIAVLGTDGVLRQSWPRVFRDAPDAADSTPYLFLPALLAIAAPMLIEHNVRGYLVVPAALLAGLVFTTVIAAQISSVLVTTPVYPLVRLVSTGAVYLTAFTLFSLSYVLDVELPASVAVVAVVAAMLGVEVFREGQVDPRETLIFSAVTGVILGEARWAMYYIPVGGYLAGLTLLLAFFLATGLLHSHLTRHLNNVVTLEYAGIAAAGVLLVAIAGQAGLG